MEYRDWYRNTVSFCQLKSINTQSRISNEIIGGMHDQFRACHAPRRFEANKGSGCCERGFLRVRGVRVDP
jgi:hypothetical protein